jgi:hypothetical protein
MNDVCLNFFSENAWILPVLAVLAVIDLIFKGIALWYSARRNQNVWFIFLLIINSVGILPIIYLLIHRGRVSN